MCFACGGQVRGPQPTGVGSPARHHDRSSSFVRSEHHKGCPYMPYSTGRMLQDRSSLMVLALREATARFVWNDQIEVIGNTELQRIPAKLLAFGVNIFEDDVLVGPYRFGHGQVMVK